MDKQGTTKIGEKHQEIAVTFRVQSIVGVSNHGQPCGKSFGKS